MCWNYMGMLTHKRLHPLHMCWNYSVTLTHKRLHPLHMCLNAHGHTFKSLCLLHMSYNACGKYVLTRVCTHYTCVGMSMAIYTHKRLYPLHRCWNVCGNIYSHTSVPITQVLECKCQYLLTIVCVYYICVGMYVIVLTHKPLHSLHMC